MRNWWIKNLCGFFLALVITGCVSQPVAHSPAVNTAKVTLLHQSNRWGSMDPCGCSVNPFGGIDREKNAIDAIKSVEGNTLFADAGNLFIRLPLMGPVKHYQGRATALTEMMNQIGLEVFAPGPNDFELGTDFLKSLEKISKFKYLSTNVVDESGKTVFAPYQVIEKNGVLYGFVSATPAYRPLPAPLKVIPAAEALKKWLPIVRAESDVVILLSQTGVDDAQPLANLDLGIPVIVGGDAAISSQEAFVYDHGKTLYVDTHVNGNLLGRLYLDLKLPFKNYTAGNSTFNHELTKLDKERFGTPNELTVMIEKEKERTRKAALAD